MRSHSPSWSETTASIPTSSPPNPDLNAIDHLRRQLKPAFINAIERGEDFVIPAKAGIQAKNESVDTFLANLLWRMPPTIVQERIRRTRRHELGPTYTSRSKSIRYRQCSQKRMTSWTLPPSALPVMAMFPSLPARVPRGTSEPAPAQSTDTCMTQLHGPPAGGSCR